MKFLIYLLPILYALSPYDLLPDFIVGVGWIDDLIVIGLLCWYHFIYRARKQRDQQFAWGYRHSTEQNQAGFQGGGSSKEEGDFEAKTNDIGPYKVLGIARDASSGEIKAAYRRLANQYHPDKVSHLGEEFRSLAEKRFKEIQDAYQALSAKH